MKVEQKLRYWKGCSWIVIAVVTVASPALAVDLNIEEWDVSPKQVQAGESIDVTWGGFMEGGQADPFTIGVYLSLDGNITDEDVLLGRYADESRGEGPFDAFVETKSVTIPSGTLPGTYFVGVFLDDTMTVAEENEFNNTRSESISISPGAPSPGRVQFTQTVFAFNEGVSTATVRVERVSGTDGAVSIDYATSAGSATGGDDYQDTSGTLSWSEGSAGVRTFQVVIFDDAHEEPDETINLVLSDPQGSVTLGSPNSATLRINDDDVGPVAECTPSDTVLCVDDLPGDRRFEVTISYDTVLGGGRAGDATVADLTCAGVTKGAVFSFFDPDNPEALVKILNGCAVNGYYWVFAGATTTVGFELTVRDTLTGAIRTWINTDQTEVTPLVDTTVFSCNN